MSLGLTHELSLAVAVLASILLVVVGGEVSPLAWLVVLVPPFSMLLRARHIAAPAASGTALGAASIVLGLAVVAIDGLPALVRGFALAVMGLVAARAITRTTLAHDLQLLVLALLLVLSGGVLNRGPSYLFFFLAFALAAVVALATRQLLLGSVVDDEGAPESASARVLAVVRARTDVVTPVFIAFMASVAVAVLVSTALLFALFPRVGFFDLGVQTAGTGQFPNEVALGGAGFSSPDDTTVVARVRGASREAFDRGLYLRGGVYDVIDERGFRQSERPPPLSRRAHGLARAPEETRYEVSLFPVARDLLFSLGEVSHVQGASGGRQNPNTTIVVGPPNVRSELRVGRPLSGMLRYDVRGGIAAPGFITDEPGPRVDDDLSHFLALPPDLDARVSALARELVGDATRPEDMALRVRTALYDGFTYSRFADNSADAAPLLAFLFVSRAGHCEYFAAAYALLLRALGIPSRVVGGYQGGVVDEEDDVVVFFGSNAHAWVEWYLEGKGWIVDDATPEAGAPRQRLRGFAAMREAWRRFWDDRIVDYSLEEQAAVLRAARTALSAERIADAAPGARGIAIGLIVVVVLALVLLVLRRARRGGHASDEQRLVAAILSALARIDGSAPSSSSTLREALSASRARDGARDTLAHAVSRYERVRFGEVAAARAETDALIRALESLAAPRGEQGTSSS